ncbi:MAG: hypothetical protein M1600_02360 [Firmicutes bacterium]|jgi:uncharacterized membrane protein|nr:hypothetical protein [Bacillota bacterium]
MGLFWTVVCRVGSLTGERLFFHFLGEKKNGLVTTMVAFGGAACLLWMAAAGSGHLRWVSAAFFPSLIYAAHFVLYVTAFSEGDVAAVSPWTNLTVLLLYLWNPFGGWLAGIGLTCFVIAMGLGVERGESRNFRPVLLMVAACLVLAVGRQADVGQPPTYPLAYAASLFTCISLWVAVMILCLAQERAVVALVRERPLWSLLSAITNAASYLTLVLLIHRLPLAALEALGSIAALLATAIGVVWLLERPGKRKMVASWLMSAGAAALLSEHLIHLKSGI